MKVMMVFDIDCETEAQALERLDAFRESVLPGPEWGITVARAVNRDVVDSGVISWLALSLRTPETFVKTWK